MFSKQSNQDVRPYHENIQQSVQYYQYLTEMSLDQYCTPQSRFSTSSTNDNQIGNQMDSDQENEYSFNIKPSSAAININDLLQQPREFPNYSTLWMGGVNLLID